MCTPSAYTLSSSVLDDARWRSTVTSIFVINVDAPWDNIGCHLQYLLTRHSPNLKE